MNKLVCTVFIIVFLFKTQTVFSNNLIYDVNNIQVTGKINNDLDSRKLIEVAFQKAFIVFVDKTLLSEDAVGLHKTKTQIIKDLIFTYQIVKIERNKKKESILTLNIKFDRKKINNFLSIQGISYADISNISLTVLPILIKEKNIYIYSDNFFYNNWKKRETGKEISNLNLIDYNLALQNIEDLQYINNNKENLELIDVKKIISLNEEKNYVFLIIYFSEGKFRAYIKSFIDNKKIDKKINLKVYSDDKIKSYNETIILLKNEINQIWKRNNLIDVNTPSFLDLLLEVSKPHDYLKLISSLDSIELIENYSVLEMTNKYIKIRIKYRGKVNRIKDKLLNKKINIQIADNVWKIKLIK